MNLPIFKINNTGFTMLELVITIMLMGILAVFSLFFIISGVKGYVFTKQNAALARKANLAMTRLIKEFNREIKEVEFQDSDSVKYVYQYDPERKRYISLVGTGTRKEIKIATGADPEEPGVSDPEVLIDQVNNFTLDFNTCDDPPVTWVVGNDMENLCEIVITLTLFLNSEDDDTITFTTTVSPTSPNYIIGSVDSVFKPFKGKIYVKSS
ncbi:type II secretion system protein [Thermodesulfobacteriota bacterium]